MFGYTTYQFQCVAPFLVWCLIGAVREQIGDFFFEPLPGQRKGA